MIFKFLLLKHKIRSQVLHFSDNTSGVVLYKLNYFLVPKIAHYNYIHKFQLLTHYAWGLLPKKNMIKLNLILFKNFLKIKTSYKIENIKRFNFLNKWFKIYTIQ